MLVLRIIIMLLAPISVFRLPSSGLLKGDKNAKYSAIMDAMVGGVAGGRR